MNKRWLLLFLYILLMGCQDDTAVSVVTPTTLPPTPPQPQPTDIRFILPDSAKVGEALSIAVENRGAVPYFFDGDDGCSLSFFDDQGQPVYIRFPDLCDVYDEQRIAPGDTTSIFTWDLRQCTDSSCLAEEPVPPGVYTVKGSFFTESILDEVEVAAGPMTFSGTFTVEGMASAPLPTIAGEATRPVDFVPARTHFTGLAVSDSVLYFGAQPVDSQGHSADGALYAVDAASGEALWRLPVTGRLQTPMVEGARLYLVTGTAVVVLNRQTGVPETQWALPCCANASSVSHDLLAVARSQGIFVFDVETGAERFVVQYGPHAPVLTADDRLLFGAPDGVFAFDTVQKEALWRFHVTNSLSYPPGISGIYVTLTEEHIFFTGADGTPIVSEPLYAGGTLFVSTDGEILALRAQTGHVRWIAPLRNETAVEMAVAGDNLLATQSDGMILAYDLDTGEKRWQFTVER